MSNDSEDEKIVQEIRENLKNIKNSKKDQTSTPRNVDWRSEDEAKDYLNNLEIEYTFQCINEKQPEACHRLANFLENIRYKYKDATELYKRNCDEHKFGRSCIVYSKNRTLGRGCDKDLLEACKYAFAACDLGQPDGCLNAGVCLSDGIGGLPKNPKESVNYYDKACSSRISIGCIKLFKLYLDGVGGIGRDPQRAFDYTKQACDYNDIYGCINASIMLKRGDGIPKDEKLAKEYKDKADQLIKEESSRYKDSGVVFGEQHR